MKFEHKLMHNNFTKEDFDKVKILLNNKKNILTQSKKVLEFERKWSKWLGVKHSTFVNSGSSANYISIAMLKIIYKNKKRNEIIVPSLTCFLSNGLIIPFSSAFLVIHLSDINVMNLSFLFH